MTYDLTENYLTIFNSYKVEKKDFRTELMKIRSSNPSHPIWKRGLASLKREWAIQTCNGYRHADLDTSHRWYIEAVYFVVGSISLLLIK